MRKKITLVANKLKRTIIRNHASASPAANFQSSRPRYQEDCSNLLFHGPSNFPNFRRLNGRQFRMRLLQRSGGNCVCLPVCAFICLPALLPAACLPVCGFTCLPACAFISLPAYSCVVSQNAPSFFFPHLSPSAARSCLLHGSPGRMLARVRFTCLPICALPHARQCAHLLLSRHVVSSGHMLASV